MQAYEAIITKRDLRAYADRPVPPDVERRILQAGRMAGSSMNAQPCRFIVITSADGRRELAACGTYMKHVGAAPLVVAIAMPSRHTAFDAGRAAQNMMVAGWADGVTSCPVTPSDQEALMVLLGLPSGMRVPFVVAFGYPGEGAKPRGQKRLPLEELVHRERW